MVLAVFAALPTFADEKPIQVGQLPEKVKSFVSTYFEGTTIEYAQVENRASLVQYEIVLSDGSFGIFVDTFGVFLLVFQKLCHLFVFRTHGGDDSYFHKKVLFQMQMYINSRSYRIFAIQI